MTMADDRRSEPDPGDLDGAGVARPIDSSNAQPVSGSAELGATGMLESLAALTERLDADKAPRDEHDFRASFNELRRATESSGSIPADELTAEEIAFGFYALDHQQERVWGIYFGPMMSGHTAAGEPWEYPSLSAVTSPILAHWRRRATQTSHPVMRARYADLLWELPKKLQNVRPDPDMARLAVDAYLEAVKGRRYDADVIALAKTERALAISLSLDDQLRIDRSRDAMLWFERTVAEDDLIGLWGTAFDTFVEPPNKRVTLTDEQRKQLVLELEERLGRFSARVPDSYHPAGAEAAATRLASYYRRRGRKDDVARVLRTYGDVVKHMEGTAAPIVAGYSLEKLYEQYRSFGMNEDADSLNEVIRKVGSAAMSDMKAIAVERAIAPEKVEAYMTAMLAGTPDDVLSRIVLHFIPDRDDLEEQLRDLAQKAPLSYLITHSIKDDEGRTVARVGSIEDDFDGQLIRHISQHLDLSVPWIREVMRRALQSSQITTDSLLAFLFDCPLFQAKRRQMLEAGITAYVGGDSMSSIHILVPQIEHAVRQLAILVGAPIYSPRRGGGLHARTLDELLRDEAFPPVLTDRIVTYLRVLLTDARGWNVRNAICHGLAPVGMTTMPVADRVLHALLVLALVRQGESASG